MSIIDDYELDELRDKAAQCDKLRMVINDALAMLADTDLHSEDRAAGAQRCLARGLKESPDHQ